MDTHYVNIDIPLPALTMQRHDIYWFEDALLLIDVHDTVFKVHGSLLARLSPVLSALIASAAPAPEHSADHKRITLDPSLGVQAGEFTKLLEYVYHGEPLTPTLSQTLALLRISSPKQLDIVKFHTLAQSRLEALISKDMSATSLDASSEELEDALVTAVDLGILPIQKRLYYEVMTGSSSAFEAEAESDATNAVSTLPPPIVEQCKRLLALTIAHFTPILFTPPATSHMECTDVFADTWMTHVIQPALESDGVYKPLETLETIKSRDWTKDGLCVDCHKDKLDEWTEEQETVWKLMDNWLKQPLESRE